MGQLRCKKCNQLLFKYQIRGNKLEIEIKCYNCNAYNYFTVWLNKINRYINDQTKEGVEIDTKGIQKIVFKNIISKHDDKNKN